ncbi:hypothetical protein F4677DRAFT_420810 [Hypoxylon crocopeplum]|nr:hypothetical protein F4677DRAFT_420810 [Hypoxylon crocopeplum]
MSNLDGDWIPGWALGQVEAHRSELAAQAAERRRLENIALRANQRHLGIRIYEVERHKEQLRNHFAIDDIPWEFEKVVGWGHEGIAALIRKREGTGKFRPRRNYRLVMKRAMTDRGDYRIRHEIGWYRRLHGAEHIANMISWRDDLAEAAIPADVATANATLDVDQLSIRFQHAMRGIFRSPRGRGMFKKKFLDLRKIDDELQLLKLAGYPLILIEYLENGTLARLINRINRFSVPHIPNRLLWSIFLCLVRACVGMAFPLERPEPDRLDVMNTQLETYTPGAPIEGGVIHNYLHVGNVMFGDFNTKHREHRLAPVLKLIDFGECLEGEGETGAYTNMHDVARLMVALISKQLQAPVELPRNYGNYHTTAVEIIPSGNGAKYPLLDTDLRDLVARCLAENARNRPSLAELLIILERAVVEKTAASYQFPLSTYETDEVVEHFVQHLILDAPTEADEEARNLEKSEKDRDPVFRIYF